MRFATHIRGQDRLPLELLLRRPSGASVVV